MRVLVIGGAGFIGSHLVDRFVKEGFQVRVLDSLDSRIHRGKPTYLPHQVDFIRGDITNRETLSQALRDVEIQPDYSITEHARDLAGALRWNAIGALRRRSGHPRAAELSSHT